MSSWKRRTTFGARLRLVGSTTYVRASSLARSSRRSTLSSSGRGASWGRAAARSATPAGDIGHVFSERSREVDLVLLLLAQDFADVLGDGELRQGFALFDSLTIGANGVVLVFEVGSEHGASLARRYHRQGDGRRRPSQIVDV